MKLVAAVLAAAVLTAACGRFAQGAATSPSPSTTARQSATASATASAPTAGAPLASPSPAGSPVPEATPFSFAVLATIADPYTVSLVNYIGNVVAQAQASEPAAVSCGPNGAGASVPPPVSTSNTGAYFADRQGVVRYLAPYRDAVRATSVPMGGSRYSTFSVSPDDKRIAVVVTDYTTAGASLRLYVEDLNGGTNHLDIFSSTGAFGLWPVGWHGQSLVVAKVHACTSGGGPFCCGMLELHVVDPTTAVRRFTIGGPQCVIVGDPSPAGAICEDTNYARANVIDWTAVVTRSFPIQGPTPALLAPDGTRAALNIDAHTTTFDPPGTSLNIYACGWIDSTHVISGGDQPRIGEVSTGKIVLLAPQGQCAGRIPGAL